MIDWETPTDRLPRIGERYDPRDASKIEAGLKAASASIVSGCGVLLWLYVAAAVVALIWSFF